MKQLRLRLEPEWKYFLLGIMSTNNEKPHLILLMSSNQTIDEVNCEIINIVVVCSKQHDSFLYDEIYMYYLLDRGAHLMGLKWMTGSFFLFLPSVGNWNRVVFETGPPRKTNVWSNWGMGARNI